MKHLSIILLSVLLFFTLVAPVGAQDADEDVVVLGEDVYDSFSDMGTGEVELFATGRTAKPQCTDYFNADYMVKPIYLYAQGTSVAAGKVYIYFQRRESKFGRIKISFVTTPRSWKLLASRLYVGLTPPAQMRPHLFPLKQDTPNGSYRHTFYIDLDDLGTQFENIYIAMNAHVLREGSNKQHPGGMYICTGDTFKAWGRKTKYWPVIESGQEYNIYNQPWGTVFTHYPWKWPVYIKVHFPYEKDSSLFACPQPRGRVLVYKKKK